MIRKARVSLVCRARVGVNFDRTFVCGGEVKPVAKGSHIESMRLSAELDNLLAGR